MRLFIALDIDDAIRDRMTRFVEGVQNFAPDARWMKPESLHVTLKFIGEQPDSAIDPIKHALATVATGYARNSLSRLRILSHRKVRPCFLDRHGSQPATGRARRPTIDDQTAALGIPKEDRPFSPHLTLARGAGGSGSPRRSKQDGPNRVFQRLQEKLAALPTPEFGTMTPRDFFLYQSQLSPKGSNYTKLARFDLQ